MLTEVAKITAIVGLQTPQLLKPPSDSKVTSPPRPTTAGVYV